MDVDMLSPQTKENSSPAIYPELPSPPTNTLSHAHTSSPTWHTPSNVSRKRGPRLAGLATTPARPSFTQQMLKHWSTNSQGRQSPQKRSDTVSSSKDSCMSSAASDEDPLNDLERAVALVIPDSPKSKQRRKTLFIPGPHCRQYDSDDTSEAWTGDEIFLGRREGPRVSKTAVSPQKCKRKVQPSPLRKCFVQAVEKELRNLSESSPMSSKVLMCEEIKAEPAAGDEAAFVTAPQEILDPKPEISGQDGMHMDGNDAIPASRTEDTPYDDVDCGDSENCSAARNSSVESLTKESRGSGFLDMRRGPLYPKLPESANSTDLDLSPASTTTSNVVRVSEENLQKWNKAQMSRPRMSRFYHPAAVTRGTCRPKADAGNQSKVVIKSAKTVSRLSGPRFQSPVLYSTCHLKTTREAEPIVKPEHTSSDADDEDESQVEDATDSPV